MGNFIKTDENPLDIVEIKIDGTSHISLRNPRLCSQQCENKPCTYFCPTRVFYWDGKTESISVIYARCVECGACPHGCPHGNIDWHFPAGGYGVVYRHG
ncbi:ferredoxin family protein [Thermoanaerobacterium sp. DL9XJH110]|jgi:ferredoxin like protein|uniref:ferredoxin family protein n=1 Tax=Thermoanaerobacterium sp. DL9XJH110 TaxID=3386643 RepID=UPI003BB7EBED